VGVREYKRFMKSWRSDRVDPKSLQSAISTIRQHWNYKPIQLGRRGEKADQYKMGPCGDAVHWGTPTWEQYMNYKEFEDNIKTLHKSNKQEREARYESKKRKAEATGDEDSDE
jgi:hypothetical protein